MPYTPPTHLSPAGSLNPSPIVSRNPSWTLELPSRDRHGQHVHMGRPALPRSTSSAQYLNKHRRVNANNAETVAANTLANTQVQLPDGTRDAECLPALSTSPSISLEDQRSPSLAGALISPTAVSSSSEPSDSDERLPRRRDVEKKWNELERAVRQIEVKRSNSPVKKRIAFQTTDSEPVTQVTSPTILAPEVRRIAHSRSNTETAIVVCAPAFHDTSTGGSDESDLEPRVKPSLVRKKSGELVKPALRPSSRRRYSSMPGTPTYNKSVKFDESGNQTRHFLQVDKPMAISCDSSPTVEYESDQDYSFDGRSSKLEWNIRLANFPVPHADHMTKPVWMERLFLSGDNKSLVGLAAVANLSFHKSVVARFTLDYWKTTSEVSAEYVDDPRRASPAPGYDRFSFGIKLSDQARLESKTMLLCVRYNVDGTEHWDNNGGANYQIDFVRKSTQTNKHMPQSALGARPLNAIPRSRHAPAASVSTFNRGRSPSVDDDIISHFDANNFKFRPGAHDLFSDNATTPTIRLKKKSSSGNLSPHSPTRKVSQGLGGRYDFGASLSAALNSAQDRLGKTSGLGPVPQTQVSTSASYFASDAPDNTDSGETTKRPDSLAIEKPEIGSDKYKALVSKFCYFTPASASPAKPLSQPPAPPVRAVSPPAAPEPAPKSQADEVILSSREESITNTPEQPSPQLDGTSERFEYRSYSTSSSSAVHAALESGSASPASYYMYHQRDGYSSVSHTPTAIPG